MHKGGKLESVVIQIIFGFLLAFLNSSIDNMKTQYSEKALGLSLSEDTIKLRTFAENVPISGKLWNNISQHKYEN